MLFLTVSSLQFSFDCLAPLLAAVNLLVISPDRTVGGRMFGAAVMTASILTGTVLGGAVVGAVSAPSH